MDWSQVKCSELIDRAFVFELARRGHVHVSLSQVSVAIEGGGSLEGLTIPPHCHLEYLYAAQGNTEDRPIATLRYVFEKRSTP